MIEIRQKGKYLVLIYQAERGSSNWVNDALSQKKHVTLLKTFSFERKHVVDTKDRIDFEYDYSYTDDYEHEIPQFILGKLQGEYYKIHKNILFTKNHFYIHKSIDPKAKYFIGVKRISIIRQIDKLIDEELYLGGSNEKSISVKIFNKAIKIFPNQYEIRKYSEARIASILREHLDTMIDSEEKYDNYLNKKTTSLKDNILKSFKDQEEYKLQTILHRLEDMLKSENEYSENQWQAQILQILMLLFPKYIAVFDEVEFIDVYNDKKRRLDYAIVDFSGHLDIIEIKKPFDKGVMSDSRYRDNFVPRRELSGTIMQIEKYIYYLNKSGLKVEEALSKKYDSRLPSSVKIRITNPRGMIIMGRSHNLSVEQINDFEIVKRKYKNIMDIFTYDDLMVRIKTCIKQVQEL